MCGIFGYLGERDAVSLVLDGLQKLEYRGYDSAGIVAISNGTLVYQKEVGKVSRLREAVPTDWKSRVAIAHTRWATHGKPSDANAHPHFDAHFRCSVVHNGIIENHEAVRKLLEKRGIRFRSETDSEVISQLIGYLYKGNFLKAVQRATFLLKGAYAIAVVHQNHPNEMVCVAKQSPLVIGIGNKEIFIASDSSAFLNFTRKVIYLTESEVALVRENSVQVFDAKNAPITKEHEDLTHMVDEVSKGSFPHWMLKEIFEGPDVLRRCVSSRFSDKFGTALLEEIKISEEELLKLQRIVILACGTSYHAAMVAAYMIEEMARIPVQVEISSEFRYKNPIVFDNTLVIAISQSGETADTLAAMRELKEKGAKVLGICNALGSTLAREASSCLFLRAGPEIGVAATKTFISQLVVLSLLSLRLARMRQMSQQDGKKFIQALMALPQQIETILEQKKTLHELAKKYAHYENFFYLGRRYMYPTAMEGALKLKEIAYVNANGYPAGEMKHGPIALINRKCPTVAFCADLLTYLKMLSSLMEIKAREGIILAIAEEGSQGIEKVADDLFFVPKTIEPLSPILSTVAGQLLAYFIALERGTPIDQPRNLAKSVTVE